MPYAPLFQYQAHTEPVSTTGEDITESRWHQPWSEPSVKTKRGTHASRQPFIAFCPLPVIALPTWFMPLSIPQKLTKPGLPVNKHPFWFQTQQVPGSATLLQGWYNWYSEPVRLKKGLRGHLHPSWTGPNRLLPTPTVTVTMAATEINADQALMAIRVFPYNAPASATVSIVEIGDDGSATSVAEV